MRENIKNLITNLKHTPGVYLMHDKDDKIIYIGKAKDLQKRVSQYFLRPQCGKVQAMVSHVAYFETIITKNEKEAFILEMNLIQTHYPKYNVMLKDGSHYPYIALKKKNDVTLLIKRNKSDKQYEYFGPYPSSGNAREMVDLLQKIFPIRKCNHIPKESCLYYHLHQCLAPCINKINQTTYDELRNEISRFLKGDNLKKRKEIENKMKKASDELNFELANQYKKIIDAIDHINDKQNVEVDKNFSADIFSYSKRNGYLSLAILLFRKGLLLGKENYIVEEFGNEEEQIANLISQFYLRVEPPKEVIINNKKVIELLDNLIDTHFISVSKGRITDLISSAQENASNALDEYFLSSKLDDNKLNLLTELGNLLKIDTPLHIELFDNSHLQGSSPVGAMVAYINGEPCKKLYRKFNLTHEETRDDLASMDEVLSRHYSRLVKENNKLPDLILLDGGLIQVESGVKSLNKLNVNIPIFGLYKNDKHQTEGLIDKDGNIYPLTNKSLFYLLTRMQDEVHRFAINFHKDKRSKSMTSSILDDVEGLGDKRKELLYRAYPDITLLKNASIEELSQLLPSDVAIRLYTKLHS